MEMKLTFTPKDRADWRAWLAANHDKEQEVWVVYLKGKRGISYEESIEEGLCFGWVDSIIQKIDEEKYARKFNPRRMDSQWSETNKRRVRRMMDSGLMTPAGLEKITFNVDAVNLDAPMPKRPQFEIPEKVSMALKTAGAWDAFSKLSPSHQRAYTGWLMDAKKDETFQRRLSITVEEVLAGKPNTMH